MKLSESKVKEKEVVEGQVEEQKFTKEESTNQLLMTEDELIRGLLEAATIDEEEFREIEIARNGKVFFKFQIAPLKEQDYEDSKKKWTKYVKNKQFGMKMPESTNAVKYRAELIYRATIKKDRELLWDNKKIWDSLLNQGFQIMNGLDVIEYCLRAGEKDRIIEIIDEISGYGDQFEEVEAIKN
ncbi:MAG: hypothetical protein KH020_16725 [Clostridiales bacterium]|uniref:Tail assembly chaperone protein n=1 Tax=Siphoviridae sp. ctdjo3 TaxID=2825583 RepID=A0A8S5PTE9_9CAUD|nr:hypothetical protein [Clostridiales bacterium]DAE09821.1 MAG TPA: tail assembly chaperone protein [Siphoviridae sp. ctdjo3]